MDKYFTSHYESIIVNTVNYITFKEGFYMNGESKAKSTAVIVAILALVVGGGAGFLLGNGKSDSKDTKTTATSQNAAKVTPDTMTKAAGLRVVLNNLETEHVELAAAATRAGFDGDPQFAAAAAALDKNSNALADAVGSVYGAEARTKFYEIWASHIGFFVDYTVAAKKGDQAGMAKAVANLGGYVEAISDFLSKANPNLPKEAVAQLVGEHVGLLKSAVDKHGANDYAGSYEAESQARTQISTGLNGKPGIADTLAGAIVKQNASKF